MKAEEKQEFVLRELYKLRNSDNYHDVEILLNDFADISRSELVSMMKYLEDKDFVNLAISKDGVDAKISFRGIQYFEKIEENIDNYNPPDPFTESEVQKINAKLDTLIERLIKLELGQEVIHTDLSADLKELKKMTKILGKKNWRQQLQGKLVDAGLGQLTESVYKAVIETFQKQLLNG